jgi:hypothetical protein
LVCLLILARWLLVRLMCFTQELTLRGHKTEAGKATSISVVVAAIVVVGAEKNEVGSC